MLNHDAQIGQFYWNSIVDPGDLNPSFPRNEETLRQVCAQSVKANPHIEPLKTIALVGGIYLDYENTTGDYSSNRDTYYLTRSMLYLVRSGIPIDPDFTVHLSNLLYNEDYLQTDTTDDIVVLGYVPRYTSEELYTPQFIQNHNIQFSAYDSDDRFQCQVRTRVEDNLDCKEYDKLDDNAGWHGGIISAESTVANWRNRLALAKPKIILSLVGNDCVSVHDLRVPDMVQPIVDATNRVRNVERVVLTEAEMKDYDYVARGLEVSFNQQFLVKVAPHIWDLTMLGAHVQAFAGLRDRPNIIDPAEDRFQTQFNPDADMKWIPRPPYVMPSEDYDDPNTYVRLAKHWLNLPKPWQKNDNKLNLRASS